LIKLFSKEVAQVTGVELFGGKLFSKWVVSLLCIGGEQSRSQTAVRGPMSANLGGSRITQSLSELILQFSALIFCSSERERSKGKNKERKETVP
jgi:hypothetical protein